MENNSDEQRALILLDGQGIEEPAVEREECQKGRSVAPTRRLNVFISSICNVPKYDNVRKRLKQMIEDTQLAVVYLFEGVGSSTMSAGDHYIFALEDSDVCIFLIDNADGVTPGVQREIDAAKRQHIKSLFYFCDETTKEKTSLELSLMGVSFAKSSIVHKFNDLIQNGARDLINDIVAIYHYYCKGKYAAVDSNYEADDIQRISHFHSGAVPQPIVSKTVLDKIDKSVNYILKFTIGRPYIRPEEGTENTSEIDEWCVRFLEVMFEGKSNKISMLICSWTS